MNGNARDAVIAVCFTAIIIAAIVVTGSLDVLWLLVLLVLMMAML